MTKQTEALKLALEAICGSGEFLFNWHDCEPNNEREIQSYQETLAANEKAFNAIREALASGANEQPAQQRIDYRAECWPESPHYKPHKQQEPDYSICPTCGGMASDPIVPPEYRKQEPVAWMHPDGRIWTFGRGFDKSTFTIPLYTTPPHRKPWRGLTEEEFQWIYDNGRTPAGMMELVEAKLREKNEHREKNA